jgi:hypothetical protein
VNTGEKLRIKKVVRSQKTGMILPTEGTLVCVTENLGRRLLLVAFADGNSEYLFDDEVECATFDPLLDFTESLPLCSEAWPLSNRNVNKR